jgi:adenylate cyclase class 2
MSEKEVEIKIAIDAQTANAAREELRFWADKIEHRQDTDIYYTAPVRDFLTTNECLRIRDTDEYTELTYKGATTEAMDRESQFWKEELDIPIDGYRGSVEALLTQIGCEELVTVEKERTVFQIDGREVTLDKVTHAGWFLEVESTAETEAEIETALERNRQLLEKIGVDDADSVDRPYRDIVIDALHE